MTQRKMMDDKWTNYVTLSDAQIEEMCEAIREAHPKRMNAIKMSNVLEKEHNIAWEYSVDGYINFAYEMIDKTYGPTLMERFAIWLVSIFRRGE